MEKLFFVICGKYWKFGKLKILYLAEKIFNLSLFVASARMQMKKYSKKNKQLKYQKF